MKIPLAIACVVACLCFAGCGDDDGGGFKPEDKFIVPASPEEVLYDFELAYNDSEYECYRPLFHDQFTFIFNPQDIGAPGVPPSGVWGRSDEIEVAQHMLDPEYVPANPSDKIENMTLELTISGDLRESALNGAPREAMEGFVNFDLKVETVGDVTYLVNSRPSFCFSHVDTIIAESDTTYTWGIWLIEDAAYEFSALGGQDDRRDDTREAGPREFRRISLKTPVTEQKSWGAVKSLYRVN